MGSTSGASSSSSSTAGQNVSSMLSIKLDRSNYPLWIAQMTPTLKSRNLMGFVDGSSPCPACFLKDKDGKVTDNVNPEYDAWIQQDQLILSWINISLTPAVLSTVARSTSARTTWVALEKRYASSSQNRILQLRAELLKTMRGDLSISDYLDKLNSIADNLALAGSPIDDNDLVSIVMNNVGPNFEMTVSSAQARDTPISYADLEALLLSAERRMASQSLSAAVDSGTTAFMASRSRGTFRGRGFHGNGRGGRGGRDWSHGNGRGRSSFPPRGGSSTTSVHPSTGSSTESFFNTGNRVHCQICERAGHSALDCFNRMNLSYEGRVPTKRLTAMAASNTTRSGDNTWLMDTGANAHITTDVQNLNNSHEYNGAENVNGIGHGSGSQDAEDPFPRQE